MGCPDGSEITNRAPYEFLQVLNFNEDLVKGSNLGDFQDSQPIYAISVAICTPGRTQPETAESKELLRQMHEELEIAAAEAAQMKRPDDTGPTTAKFLKMHHPELPMNAVSCPTVKPRPKFSSPKGDFYRELKPGETMDMFCTAANSGVRLKTAEELAASVSLRIPHEEETWMRVNSSYGWEWWIDAAGQSYYFNPNTKEIKYSWSRKEINAILGPKMFGESSAHEPGTVFTLGSYEALVNNSSSN